jgi:hypothetical protein
MSTVVTLTILVTSSALVKDIQTESIKLLPVPHGTSGCICTCRRPSSYQIRCLANLASPSTPALQVNLKKVFLERKMRGLSPNFYIHIFVSDLYIFPRAVCLFGCRKIAGLVEGLYCNRPIQCLASSEILTPPHPLTAWRVLVRGEDTLAGWRWGGGSIVRKTPDTAL